MIKGKDYIGVGCWGLITNDQGQVLLLKKKGSGYWERPGGQVEKGEAIEDCILREIEEETGIKVKIVGQAEVDQFISDEHWIVFSFRLEHISGVATNKEPELHDDVRWFPLSDLPSDLSRHAKNALDKLLKITTLP